MSYTLFIVLSGYILVIPISIQNDIVIFDCYVVLTRGGLVRYCCENLHKTQELQEDIWRFQKDCVILHSAILIA